MLTEQQLQMVQLAGVTISALSLVFLVVYVWKTWEIANETKRYTLEARRSTYALATLNLMHEWQFELGNLREETAAKLGELRALANQPNPPTLSSLYSQYPGAFQISHFFYQVGAIVLAGHVDEDLIVCYLAGSTLFWWQELAPFIQAERKTRPGGLYREYFEDFARRVAARPHSERLKTERFSTNGLDRESVLQPEALSTLVD
ncbi:MAG TPA: hypothetical protein VKV73_17125 [Chloroflexota bacterium]|nr:hypothetical protein [Chloroflexota bacterium]